MGENREEIMFQWEKFLTKPYFELIIKTHCANTRQLNNIITIKKQEEWKKLKALEATEKRKLFHSKQDEN